MNFNWTDLTGQIRFHDPAGTSFFLQEKVYLLGVAKGRQKITGKQNNRICPYMIYKTNVKYYIVMNKLIPITNWFAKYPFGSGLNRDISAVASGLIGNVLLATHHTHAIISADIIVRSMGV